MRSTQKKGPRTPALILARRLCSASSIQTMYTATQTATLVNAAWRNSVAVLNSGFDAHGASADVIARAAGFREPPEPEPTTQTTPNKPPPAPGGAEACAEHPMENLENLGQMAAFEWARANATPGCDPAAFGKKVLRVYRACVSPASEVPRSTSNGTPQVVAPRPEHLSRSEADFPARSSADL